MQNSGVAKPTQLSSDFSLSAQIFWVLLNLSEYLYLCWLGTANPEKTIPF